MNNSTHMLCIKMLVDRLKHRGYLGSCSIEKAGHILALFEAGSLKGLSSLRFTGGAKDLPIGELDNMLASVLAHIGEFRGAARGVATYYGVPEDSAEIFAEDMAALVLGGDMCGWRHSTTRDVFRHIHSTYRPKEYLVGRDLHEKCTDAQYVRGMLYTLNELISFGSRRA